MVTVFEKSDCLHLQLYRDPKDRYKKGQSKASLSLQHFLGFESGFTLDKESNTIAIICQDVTVVLAFETRERLIAWQVKVGSQLGSPRQFLVMVGGGGRKLPAGPARLHLQGGRFAMTSGVPPRLLGVWELGHLRRYGVVDGRFCFEGGSHCGKGEGLHVLITDQAQDLTDTFRLAAEGKLTPDRRPLGSRKSTGTSQCLPSRPDTRLSDFNVDPSADGSEGSALYEEGFFSEDCDRDGSWREDVTLERCAQCVMRLEAPGGSFTPAWTMEGMQEQPKAESEYLTPRLVRRELPPRAPLRPPKPPHFVPLSTSHQCTCGSSDSGFIDNPKVGPYENYDVPKATPIEVDNGEYYDTPKRIKEVLGDDLFRITNGEPGSLVLKKNCGCILKLASKKKASVSVNEDKFKPVECPCQRVTNWASSLIRLPYCRRDSNNDLNNAENIKQINEDTAIYATVDVSRKTNRQSNNMIDKDVILNEPLTNYENVKPDDKERANLYANYQNLDFAMSLEYYENAKDLFKKAGVTQKELDALGTNFNSSNLRMSKLCTKCGHSQPNEGKPEIPKRNKSDEYLLMQPSSPNETNHVVCNKHGQNLGYTPMSPIPNWSQSLKHTSQNSFSVEIEKSMSIPALNGSKHVLKEESNNSSQFKNRSSSVDSTRLLEDLKEFDSSLGSHATSLETLRNSAITPRPYSGEGYDQDWGGKSSASDQKTESSSDSKEIPNLRNKLIDNAQIKRSSSVPCKSGGNRDSSSSNDSGVSSCSLKQHEFGELECPGPAGHMGRAGCRARGVVPCVHASLPRKSKSSELRGASMQLPGSAKSSSAEAEIPVLPPKQIRAVLDSRSTSSGTSDMSDYIETLSLSSDHSSTDMHGALRLVRQPTSTLRPRSGKEYHNLDPSLTHTYTHRTGYTHMS